MNEMYLPKPGKKWAIIATSFTVLSVLLFILSSLGTYGYNHAQNPKFRSASNIFAEITAVLFVLATFIGLIVGIVALVKNIRNPALYGARGLTIAAAAINFLLFGLGCIILFFIIFYIYLMNI